MLIRPGGLPCFGFRMATAAALLIAGAFHPGSLRAQRSGKQTARDLFYAEAGLIVSSQNHKGRFAAAKKSVIAITLGLKYGLSKVSAEQAAPVDPAGPLSPGDAVRLDIEVNDTGYLYIVQRQASGAWKLLFPTPEIEHGSQFVRSHVVYSIPPAEGLKLEFPGGAERFFVVLARQPVKELEGLMVTAAAGGAAGAALPEVSEETLDKLRNSSPSKDLLTERSPSEKAVYVVNRSGKPESVVTTEIRFGK